MARLRSDLSQLETSQARSRPSTSAPAEPDGDFFQVILKKIGAFFCLQIFYQVKLNVVAYLTFLVNKGVQDWQSGLEQLCNGVEEMNIVTLCML